jgi:chromosome segregation ATPase
MIKDRNRFVETKHSAYIIQRYYRHKRNQIILREKLSELVENARMENRLSQLQEQVHVLSPEADAEVDMGRKLKQPVNEDMMKEVESMFGYLRKEISDLRAENEELQMDANAFDEENRELRSHLQAAQAASQMAKGELADLEKSNEELHLEAKASKAKVAELKKELKSREEVQVHDVDGMRKDYEKGIADRDAEIRKMKGDLKASKRALRMEREMLTDEVERVQEEHLAEIMRLKNELRKTRDSHHDYLAKLMDGKLLGVMWICSVFPCHLHHIISILYTFLSTYRYTC